MREIIEISLTDETNPAMHKATLNRGNYSPFIIFNSRDPHGRLASVGT